MRHVFKANDGILMIVKTKVIPRCKESQFFLLLIVLLTVMCGGCHRRSDTAPNDSDSFTDSETSIQSATDSASDADASTDLPVGVFGSMYMTEYTGLSIRLIDESAGSKLYLCR